MSVPNLKSIVLEVYARGGFDLTKTKEGQGEFTRAVAVELHKANPAIGMLYKSAGRTHVIDDKGRRHAADAVLYRLTGQSIDVVSKASPPSPESKPGWTVDIPRYSDADWFAPDYDVVTPPDPPPVPPPVPPVPPAVDYGPRIEALQLLIEHLDVRLRKSIEAHESLVERVLRLENAPSPQFELPDLVAEGTISARAVLTGSRISLPVRKA